MRANGSFSKEPAGNPDTILFSLCALVVRSAGVAVATGAAVGSGVGGAVAVGIGAAVAAGVRIAAGT